MPEAGRSPHPPVARPRADRSRRAVSVAIPVRDGGELLARVLAALADQTVEHELLICDSGSRDGSPELARAHGARVLEIAPERFTHGGVRNQLIANARGAHVALLTQDSEPAGPQWLERLLEGFQLAADVGIVYGPYRPRVDASFAVRSELERWFTSLSPDGSPQVERLAQGERSLAVLELIGRRGFFTDANACLARAAWERVPFREVPYAEDRVLAIDMLRAGYAKAFLPQAVAIHSHDYTAREQLRRAFDEWRGLLEVYGWREPASPPRLLGQLRGVIGQAQAELLGEGLSVGSRRRALAAVGCHHAVRVAGSLLGSHADRLPAGARRRLSLEGRAGFTPLDLDARPMRSGEDAVSRSDPLA
jgi:GT2 family glycosyltransferase